MISRPVKLSFKVIIISALSLPLLFCVSVSTGMAGSATWNLNPISSDWNTAANWTPATVPNGVNDVATFDASSITNVTVSSSVQVSNIVFNAGAPAYSIAPANNATNLTFNGTGVINNSGILQNLGGTVDVSSLSTLLFMKSSSPDHLVSITQTFSFNGSANAGDCTFVVGHTFNRSFFNGEASAASGNFQVTQNGITFDYTSTAADASFVLNGSAGEQLGSVVSFLREASAGNATFTVEGATSRGDDGRGGVFFADSSSADNATIVIAGGTNGGNGGYLEFTGLSTGGQASITLSGNATFDISGHSSSSDLTVGSLGGEGKAFLGQHNLNLGSNSSNTTFSGILQDGGNYGGTGGSLTKIGSGVLTLAGANTYTGSTNITRGVLLVNNRTGSATGMGIVRVQAGILGGRGIINGQVIVGDTRAQKATLAPSAATNKPARLTINGGFSFASDGIYNCKINTKTVAADQVVGTNVTIDPAAQFALTSTGNVALPAGTVFTVVDNTGTVQIGGRFVNLADGATIIAGPNTYQANYEGGDGNDLTLTVVQ